MDAARMSPFDLGSNPAYRWPIGGTMRAIIFASFAAITLGACATEPEPCTSEWYDWKTERIVADFANDHRGDLTELKDTVARFTGPTDTSLGNIATTASIVAKATVIGASFLGDAFPEIKQAVGQCGTAPTATRFFASLLRREGFDERAVKAVEDLGLMLDGKS
jgi:hypothetical protein